MISPHSRPKDHHIKGSGDHKDWRMERSPTKHIFLNISWPSVIVWIRMPPYVHIFEYLVTKGWHHLKGLEKLRGMASLEKVCHSGWTLRLWGFKTFAKPRDFLLAWWLGYSSWLFLQHLLHACYHAPCHVNNGLSSETVSKPLFKCFLF